MATLNFAGQIGAHSALSARTPRPLPRSMQQVRKPEVDRQTALREIYEAHVDQIYKFVLYKVCNREDAEDITSQVFFKAAQSLDVEQEEQTRLAWLYQVARTTISDHWRSFYKTPASSLEQMEEAGMQPILVVAQPTPSSADDADSNEHTARLATVLNVLPDNYRKVLQLRFLNGCSLKETAQAMGITEGNAKVLQHRALHRAAQLGTAA